MTFRTYVSSIFVFAATAICATAHAAIPISERTALLDLYTSTNGGSWTTSTGWNGVAGTECTWFRVTCDGTSSHVTGIGLNNNHLTGSLPSLNGLSNLSDFRVYSNQLTGTIPSLTGLTNLNYFDAGFNQLTGTIPALTGLTNLGNFSVFYNQLTGTIPALAGLTNLGYFNVGINQLTGTIPSLSGLSNLNYFNVDSNQLTGSIPDLTGLTALSYFRVGANHLDGTLPVAPSSLFAGQSTLCPNDFPESSYVDAPVWDAATGVTPWFTPCKIVFVNGFE